MFKKKARKQQGVLQLTDEPVLQVAVNTNQTIQQNPGSRSGQATISLRKEQQKNSQSQLKGQINSTLGPKNQTDQLDLPDSKKRSKNQETLYNQDANEQLDNQPIRRQKQTFNPIKQRGGIGNSTLAKNQELRQQVHDAFSDRNYRAGDNLIKDMGFKEDELEEVKAKRLFLQNVQKTKLAKQGKLNTKIYRGANAYVNHQLTTHDIENAQEAYKKKMGPSRINSTIKNTCRFDYVLNLCKDWHDSGYCPFGNSCLYLHDRSNYKTGWELEKQFQQQERERWKRINNPELAKKQDQEKRLKTIEKYKPPQFCEQCRKQFINPVQVECSHIFCTACAIKLLKCKICNKRLSGIMNNATEKLAKLRQSYEQMVTKLENQQQQTLTKRRKFQHVDGLDVFAD